MGRSMQLTENQVTPGTDAITGLCIGCALLHHDYREMLWRDTGDVHFSEMPLPEAWIDGRRHRLLPHIGSQSTVCGECNTSVPSLYMPAE
jgi:hypothetical protein